MTAPKLLYELGPDKKDALEQYPELRDVLEGSLRHSAVAPAARQLLKMLSQHRETKAFVARLESALSDLEARDRDRLTAARAEGRPDPGKDDVEKAEKELEFARRLLDGDKRALAKAEQRFLGAFAGNRGALDEWLRQETDAVEEEKEMRAIEPYRGDLTPEAYDHRRIAAAPYNAKLELLSWAASSFATAGGVRHDEVQTVTRSSDMIVRPNEPLGGYTFESKTADQVLDGDVDRARRARRLHRSSSG